MNLPDNVLSFLEGEQLLSLPTAAAQEAASCQCDQGQSRSGFENGGKFNNQD